MRKFLAIAFFMVGTIGVGNAQEMPIALQEFLDNYKKNVTANFGPRQAMRHGLFSSDSVQIEDLQLKVLEVYRFKHTYLSSYPDTVPLSELIEPDGQWRVLVTAHNKPLYDLRLDNYTGELKCISMGFLDNPEGVSRKMWELLVKAYPDSTNINPIYFSRLGYPFNATECFLYFKQKGPRKIYYIRPGRPNDELEKLFSGSIETLDDSQKLMRYWKEQGLDEVGRKAD